MDIFDKILAEEDGVSEYDAQAGELKENKPKDDTSKQHTEEPGEPEDEPGKDEPVAGDEDDAGSDGGDDSEADDAGGEGEEGAEGDQDDKGEEGEPATGDDPEQFIKKLNETLGTELSSIDDIKESLEKVSQVEDLSKENEDLKDKVGKLTQLAQELKDLYDPEKIFVSEAEAKRQMLLRKYPEYDPSVLTKVVNADFEKLSPGKVIIMNELLKNGDVYDSEADVIAQYEADYEIDLNEDLAEMESVQRNKVKLMAKEALKNFAALKADVSKDDGKLNILAERETLIKESQENLRKRKEDWIGYTPKLHTDIPDFKFTIKDDDGKEDQYEFKLGTEYREQIKANSDKIAEYLANNGLELSDESRGILIEDLKKDFWYKNRDLIVSSLITDAVAKHVKKEAVAKTNPKTSDKTKAPPENKTDRQKNWDKADDEVMSHLTGK